MLYNYSWITNELNYYRKCKEAGSVREEPFGKIEVQIIYRHKEEGNKDDCETIKMM